MAFQRFFLPRDFDSKFPKIKKDKMRSHSQNLGEEQLKIPLNFQYLSKKRCLASPASA